MKRKKTFYLAFQDQPRIYRTAPPKDCFYIKNPDLKRTRGIPMHEWRPEMFEEDWRPGFELNISLKTFHIAFIAVGSVMGLIMLATCLYMVKLCLF